MNNIPNTLKNINVFIYSIGKTGSTTLHETMIKNGYQSLHVHGNEHYQLYIIKNESHTLFDLIKYSIKHQKKIYIIDVYRNPIERKISSFFHNFNHWLPHNVPLTLNDTIDIFNKTIKDNIKEASPFHDCCDEFNIPIPDAFDFTNEYLRIDYNNVTLIKLRFSSINKWDTILSQLFEKPIKMYNTNLTENKRHYLAQKEFLRNYKPTQELLEEIRTDPYFRYFNTEQEQEEYLNKWKLKLNT